MIQSGYNRDENLTKKVTNHWSIIVQHKGYKRPEWLITGEDAIDRSVASIRATRLKYKNK